ncbi:hypothetical protein MCP1_110051 [Candidatus Terasakiella magnetica]|nr:hypothetical protein MCP1_110051 [Candidatus Terasakiella magnetica]
MLNAMLSAAANGGSVGWNPVSFASSDLKHSASPLSGCSDSYTGTLSFWVRMDAADGGAIKNFVHGGVGYVQLWLDTSNILILRVQDTGGSYASYRTNSAVLLQGSAWRHVAASWDTNAGASSKQFQMYIDGVAQSCTRTDPYAAFQQMWGSTPSNLNIAGADGMQQLKGSLAQFYLNTSTRIDLSTGLSKFYSGGKPVSLGPTGAIPTGSQPAVFIGNPAATVTTNLGFAGNFAKNGTPTDTTGL